jgi:hypothetical protein
LPVKGADIHKDLRSDYSTAGLTVFARKGHLQSKAKFPIPAVKVKAFHIER